MQFKHTLAWLSLRLRHGHRAAQRNDVKALQILAHALMQAKRSFHDRSDCFVLLIQAAEDDLLNQGGRSVSRVKLQLLNAN